MRKPILTALLLVSTTCATAADELSPREAHGKYGLMALDAGYYGLAISYLKRATEQREPGEWYEGFLRRTHEKIPEWRLGLARAYWESGKDGKLYEHLATMSDDAAHPWYCRLLERRGFNLAARQCWSEYEDEAYHQVLRTGRTDSTVETFMPGYEFGRRPPK